MLPAFSKERAAQELGVTTGVIDGYMEREWTNGIEYVVKGRQTYIYIEELERWLNGLRESSQGAEVSKSNSGGMESEPIRKSSRATRTRKLILPPQLITATS